MIEYCVDQTTVERSIGLTLKERCSIFTTKFPGTKMSASFLGRLYKKNIVRKKKVLIKKSTDSR